MIFVTYLLCAYNKLLSNLMVDCLCYKNYCPEENFIKNVITNRGSYMACLCYESTKRNRIGHRSIPIMLGSKLDYLIRGRDAVIESRALWGLVVLRGGLTIYPNFSTFDSLSMHVRQTKHLKSIDWFMYVNDEGLAISYNNKSVTWTHKRETYTGIGWVELLQKANPFGTNIVQSNYIAMFDTMLHDRYSMNDLRNRQIINGAMAITKYIQFDLARRKKQKAAGCQKLAMVFESGNLYPAFNKKNTVDPDENNRQYSKAYHNTMHEGRSSKTEHLLANVIRSSNAAVRNSNALSFPTDAVGFFCMLNMKDLKSAGEQNVLCDMVIMTEETDQMKLFEYIKSIALKAQTVSSTTPSIRPTTTSAATSVAAAAVQRRKRRRGQHCTRRRRRGVECKTSRQKHHHQRRSRRRRLRRHYPKKRRFNVENSDRLDDDDDDDDDTDDTNVDESDFDGDASNMDSEEDRCYRKNYDDYYNDDCDDDDRVVDDDDDDDYINQSSEAVNSDNECLSDLYNSRSKRRRCRPRRPINDYDVNGSVGEFDIATNELMDCEEVEEVDDDDDGEEDEDNDDDDDDDGGGDGGGNDMNGEDADCNESENGNNNVEGDDDDDDEYDDGDDDDDDGIEEEEEADDDEEDDDDDDDIDMDFLVSSNAEILATSTNATDECVSRRAFRGKTTTVTATAATTIPNKTAPPTKSIISINGYLIDCVMEWTLDTLVAVKRKFPHITTQYFPPYVILMTRPCIPVKYSEQYDTFFSPAEITHFRIVFPEADMLSITAKQLPIESLIKTPPAKSTVSINNIKGSVAVVTSPLHELLMKHSLGVTCFISISPDQVAEMIDRAVISHGHDTSHFMSVFKTLDDEFKLTEGQSNKPQSTHPKAAMQALDRLYPASELLYECRKTESHPFKKMNCLDREKAIRDYRSIIFDAKLYRPPSIWNLRLRAAFGNPFGACIEDGVVIDSNILPFLPKVHYNACITVEFSFKTVKFPKHSTFITVETEHGVVDNDVLIGCLVTEHDVYVKHSKHTQILTHKIGDHHFYLIKFIPKKTNMYDNLKVKHIHNNDTITVIITGQTVASIGVGSKVANAFGQKNIISMVTDLRNCSGITRDGRKVHAQIVYSEVSLVARVISGQLHNMFVSDELAIGENGIIIAPVDLVLHTLHPYTNIRVIRVKNDTLTNINGFDSQNLSCTSKMLRSHEIYTTMMQILGLHGFDAEFSTISVGQPIILHDNH